MGRPAFESTILAQALPLRKLRGTPGLAFDGQLELLHRSLRAFDRTIAMVVATIQKQHAQDWGKPYTAEREPEAADRFQIFVRCAGHAYHHVGQIVYLTRELART